MRQKSKYFDREDDKEVVWHGEPHACDRKMGYKSYEYVNCSQWQFKPSWLGLPCVCFSFRTHPPTPFPSLSLSLPSLVVVPRVLDVGEGILSRWRYIYYRYGHLDSSMIYHPTSNPSPQSWQCHTNRQTRHDGLTHFATGIGPIPTILFTMALQTTSVIV